MNNEKSLNEILMELREIRCSIQYHKPVYSFREFCNLASLSEDYVRKLHAEGKIPFSRPFGRKLYISKIDAIQILTQNMSTTAYNADRTASDYLLKSKLKHYD